MLQVVSRCYQLLTSVFQAPPTMSIPYIQALGPLLLRFLQVNVERTESLQHDKRSKLNLTDELLLINDDYKCVSQKVERSRPQSQEELSGVLEGVRALEALVQAADESQREYKNQSVVRISVNFH